jgi:Domain of unknown function (DUF1840)
MLVQFDSDVGGLTVLGDTAVQLLQLMGHSGTVPSAILSKDIPAAVEKLERALARSSADAPSGGGDQGDHESEPRISLRQRAFPLIQLLKAAAKQGCDLTWDRR